jgi:four helix bundle protein
MQYFDHEKLDVYQRSIEFVVIIESIIQQFPKGRAYLADQLQRAGSSVTLNIAEGAGEFSTNEKIRFYRMARRSATECAGILDICMRLNLIDENIGSKSR